MYLIQLFLPLYDQQGSDFPNEYYRVVRDFLTERFGGITTYSRAPAKGFWKEEGTVQRDDIIVFEVMIQDLDRKWWDNYRKSLEAHFHQDEILVRAQGVEVI